MSTFCQLEYCDQSFINNIVEKKVRLRGLKMTKMKQYKRNQRQYSISAN